MFLISTLSYADSKCAHLYPNGIVLSVKNTIELCNTEYVAVYNTATKGNVFSSQKLNYIDITRKDYFKSDLRIDSTMRAELTDYSASALIYDRGHMASAEDTSDYISMREADILSNVTPMLIKLNRGKWSGLEKTVRSLKPVYILTGAVYLTDLTIGSNKIPVPSYYLKCAWVVKDSQPICFKALNDVDTTIYLVSYSEVKSRLKIQ